MTRLGVGGGCHWCTEAVFEQLRGVTRVEQGFIASVRPDDALSEAVLLDVDEETLPLAVLIEVHLRTHASQSDHSMRGKYRSAVYAEDPSDLARIGAELRRLNTELGGGVITRALPLRRFEPSPERFQNYYSSRPEAPFCKTHIDPKLALLRRFYSDHVNSERE